MVQKEQTSARVIQLSSYRNQDTVQACEGIIAMSKSGDVDGIVFAIHHRQYGVLHPGATGSFLNDPTAGAIAAKMLLAALSAQTKEMYWNDTP
jgi:hypothetical protein